MKISIYGNYYLPYILKSLERDGNTVLFNKFSPDIDVCVVESRFFMYEIYRNLKIIKKNKIKLINSILDIPPWKLYYNNNLNTIKNYLRQTFYNYTNKNNFLFNSVNFFRVNNNKSRYIKNFNSLVQHYFNTVVKNRIYFLKNYRKFLRFSDLNLSLSKYTQKTVKRILKLDTKVCYPCVNSDYLLNLPKAKLKYDAINISRIAPFKHQEVFVKAAKKLDLNIIVLGRHSHPNIKLDCPHFYYKDHNKVMNILNEAAFYVDASEFEGFGMTPVEAAFLDKMSIVSNTYIHREVLGDYPLYFEINNVDDLVEKMKIVVEGRYSVNTAKIKKKYSIPALKKRLMCYIESLF